MRGIAMTDCDRSAIKDRAASLGRATIAAAGCGRIRDLKRRRHLVLELTAVGNDYLACAMGEAQIGSECGRVLLAVMQEARERRRLRRWPYG
jgi:hypothetical protein